MKIYPAIDIRNQKCVRLIQGKADQEKIYGEDPVIMAKQWVRKGAKALHVVDLDRAITGESNNLEVIQKIIQAVEVPVQLGGGLRSIETVEEVFNIGCARAILGTKAYEDKALLRALIEKYAEKIVVSVDTNEGKLAIKGWTEQTEKTIPDFLSELEAVGVSTIVFTDISKDGMMQGPNIPLLKEVLAITKMDVIASGGVTTKEDIEHLREIEASNLEGAIVGKALYEGMIQLEEVL